MGAINLGPFAIPVGLVLLLCAVSVSLALAKWVVSSPAVDIEPRLWSVLIVALFAARIAFVFMYLDIYRKTPLGILDIRDGGFFPPAGILAALVMAGWFIWRKRDGRKPLAFTVLAGISIWVLGVAASMAFNPGPAQMPQLALTRLDGSAITLQSLTGKPIVINLWATWCPPCRREMPVLRDGQGRYKDVVFVFANQGESAETVRAYLNGERLVLDNVLLDSGRSIGSQTGSQAMPTTLFFNQDGMLVSRRVGELSEATLAQRIESLRAP
jgi:thiol-disulfide isomerase/thioredoxin